jgi:hypothetical protein
MHETAVTEWRAVSRRWQARATALAALIAWGGFVAALANRDRWVALLLGALGIYLTLAADRSRRS